MKVTTKLYLKNSINFILIPLIFVSILFLGAIHVNAAGTLYVNSTTFPDDAFRQYIENTYARKKSGKVYLNDTDLQNITVINLNNQTKIVNLKGIEYFPNLKELYLTQCSSLSDLDISYNTKLEKLTVTNSKLTTINVTNNPELIVLNCQMNQISKLNLAKNTKLKQLDCRGNKITSLDLSKNPNLVTVDCHNNSLTGLAISACTKLTYFDCSSNNFSRLDFSANTNLTELYCEGNKLTSVDVSKCTRLEYFVCSNNSLSSINLDENVYLTSLHCNNNKISSLSVNNIRDIKEVYAQNNNLNVLRIDTNGVLKEKIKKATKTPQSDGTIQYSADNEICLWIDKATVIADIANNKPQSQPNKNVDQEAVKQFVSRLYYIALERTSIDQEGLNFWVNELVAGKVAGGQVGYDFITSQEFKNKKYSDEAFVEKMYKTFLDRDPDVSGKQHWINSLKSGISREEVAAGFANSKEFEDICKSYGINRGTVKAPTKNTNNNQNTNNNKKRSYFVIDSSNVNTQNLDAYIERLYTVVLGRNSDPSGKEHWRKGIIEGTKYDAVTVARIGFFSSTEYLAKNKSDEQFITDAYHAFLGRDPDPSGFEHWKNELQSKRITRNDMLDVGFGNSAEFKTILESYGFRVTVINN